MQRKIFTFFIFLASLWTLLGGAVFSYTSPGKSVGFVNDFAGVMDAGQRQQLEGALRAFEQETSHEIVVATVKTLDGDDIDLYANRLYREWGIGKKGENNGALFLVSLEEKKMNNK